MEGFLQEWSCFAICSAYSPGARRVEIAAKCLQKKGRLTAGGILDSQNGTTRAFFLGYHRLS